MNAVQIKWCEEKVQQMKAQIKAKGKLSSEDYEKIVDAVGTLIDKAHGNKEVRTYFFDNLLEPLDRGAL